MRQPLSNAPKPTKIVALGLNYRQHALEYKLQMPKAPLVFIKPSTSVIGHGESIIYPGQATRVDFEAELAVVIGEKACKVPANRVSNHIMGYTCLNDVTERHMQGKDGQWTRAKGFDTFCPMGPEITDEIDPDNVILRSYLNGDLRQESSTSNMIFSISHILAFVSGIMTLLPGDVVATGTPSGFGPMKPGDEVTIEVEGVGRLVNPVKAA